MNATAGARRHRLYLKSAQKANYFFFDDFFAAFFFPPAFFFAATGLTSFLVRFSRSAACTPPPNARERHGCRGRAGAGEAGNRKQRGKIKTRGATTGRDRPSESAIHAMTIIEHGSRRFVSVALLQLLALIVSTLIRARLSAH
jgi:hypothetical protein